MANPSLIPLPAPLRMSGNIVVKWKRFHGQWQNYVIKATKIDKEDADRQVAIFRACIGSDAYDIYTTLEFESEDDREKPDKLIEAFERHCIGEVNEIYERYVFNKRQQQPGESFDAFLGDLRRLMKTCGYGTVEESTIRDRIVLGIRDDATRKKILQTRTLDLVRAVNICRSSEATKRQLKDRTTPDELKALRQQAARSSLQRSSSRYRRLKSRDGRETDRRAPTDVTTSSVVASSVAVCINCPKTRVKHIEQRVPPVVKEITLLPFVVQNMAVKNATR
jgi:uncharacterized protein YerC